MATDTFKQLFPDTSPTSTHNIRAQPAYNWIGRAVSHQFEGVTVANATQDDQLMGFAGELMINSGEIVGADGSDFSIWSDWYQPIEIYNDDFTPLFTTNFSDPWATYPYPIYGYGNDTAPQPQTFTAENIVLLQDGICASTCAVFAEMMKGIMGVKSVVVDGRPQWGPMQGVGAVKGSLAAGMFDISNLTAQLYALATPEQIDDFNAALDGGSPGSWVESTMYALSRASPNGLFGVKATVNYQNIIRPGDETVTPLQFVYEAADCRYFYTADMYSNQEAVWDMAYDLMWGNNRTCVDGSTGHPSVARFTGAEELASPPDNARNTLGADDTVFDLGSAVVPTKTVSGPFSMPSSSGTMAAMAKAKPRTKSGADSNVASMLFGFAAVLTAIAAVMV